ncbi:alpha/beta hydrolase [Prauserella cavernicola]|uniref:Alpha/beta fold hydrolase n=1 Tax=Prauserella cavernicola TaxID=2800127 RepID=A0A934R0W5_9PSEU|nr:alpha/beta fold hydrolase [Prauserella cavernicola]MBK1789049.1 alpha/beta fold hydrolase [Prauserella cavernicola]
MGDQYAGFHLAAQKRAARGDLHRIRRPLGHGAFDLTYVRTGSGDGPPVFVLPGGPGLASVLPYEQFRDLATARGLDVLMMEHRGVGFSRRDVSGVDLPWAELSVDAVLDDMAAVLDDCGVRQAIVHGSSYGSYLAAAFGARHPEHVAGMVLDSPTLGASTEAVATATIRRLFWDGDDERTRESARTVRFLVENGLVPAGEAARVVQVTYEFGGLALLDRLLGAVRDGRGGRTWRWIAQSGESELTTPVPYVMEFDLVGAIAYRELGHGTASDGGPLDLSRSRAARQGDFPLYEGDAVDLPAALPHFTWPTVAVSGERDLRTPRSVAEQVVELVPDAVLLPIDDLGHSALDGHPLATLLAADAIRHGSHTRLPELAGRISTMSRHGRQRMLDPLISARLVLDRVLPRTPPGSG